MRLAILLLVVFSVSLTLMSPARAQQTKTERKPSSQSTSVRTEQPAEQTATAKDGRTVILRGDGTWKYVQELPSPKAGSAEQRRSAPIPVVEKPARHPEMDLEEKFKLWKGQKVVLLPMRVPDQKGYLTDWRYPELRRFDESEKLGPSAKVSEDEFFEPYASKGLPGKEYAGKEGTLVDVRTRVYVENTYAGPRDWGPVVEGLVSLAGTEEKVMLRASYQHDLALGFVAEMEMAKAAVGRSVWKKGDMWEGPKLNEPAKNTQPVLVSRAEWTTEQSDGKRPITLWFKSAIGKEAPKKAYCVFDNRFHVERETLCFTEEGKDYYFEDPHVKFPNWSEQVWTLIENREVAVGMTEDMAQLACVDDLRKFGAVLSITSPSDSGVIYQGCVRKFLVSAGKVTKYVE